LRGDHRQNITRRKEEHVQRSFKTTLVQLLRRITARLGNRYRPEQHYMRGPGPKSLGKKPLSMAANGRDN
jgi:hypothetical protein